MCLGLLWLGLPQAIYVSLGNVAAGWLANQGLAGVSHAAGRSELSIPLHYCSEPSNSLLQVTLAGLPALTSLCYSGASYTEPGVA